MVARRIRSGREPPLQLTGLAEADVHQAAAAPDGDDATAGADSSGRRRTLIGRAAMLGALIVVVAVALPRLSTGPEPVDVAETRISDLGISVAVPDGWLHGRQFFSDDGIQMAPPEALAGTPRATPVIYGYTIEYLWEPRLDQFIDIPPEGLAAWLRSNPSFTVESETPVTVAGQETVTLRFRPEAAASGDRGVPMSVGAPTRPWEDGPTYWHTGDVALVTPLEIGSRTVLIEAVVASADLRFVTEAAIAPAYEAVLRSARLEGDGASTSATGQVDYGIRLPEIGDWHRDATGASWTDLGGGLGAPLPHIEITPVRGVVLDDGACCGIPAGGLLPWLERDSGLQVLSTTSVVTQAKEVVVYEVTAEADDFGDPDQRVWATGQIAVPDPTAAATAEPGYSPDFAIEAGARTLVALVVHDSNWLAVVARLPDDAVAARQLRADYLLLLDNAIVTRTAWWAGSRG